MADPSRKYQVDTSQEGMKLLNQYRDAVKLLAGCTKEMFGENKTMLLSPVFREMIFDKAKEVEALHLKISRSLFIDWPYDAASEANSAKQV